MFDDILRGLARIPHRQMVSVRVPLDEDGYYDRRCPASECGREFKVLFEDWDGKVPEVAAYCAICRQSADPSDFNTDEQSRYFQQQALAHLRGQVDDVFRGASGGTTRAGLFTMKLTYRPGAPQIVIPAVVRPTLEQRSECEMCRCRYASLGAAFFCPACGHNSARSTFAGAVATVRAGIELSERLPSLMEDRDAAADIGRHLAEDGLVRLWSSFQRFAEATYEAHPASSTASARRNAFQNLAESDRLWSHAIGATYADMLAAAEHRDLVRLVQQRHVLAHKDGIVDADYVARSGDRRYAVGQRLVVTAGDVRRLADLAEELARELAARTTPP